MTELKECAWCDLPIEEDKEFCSHKCQTQYNNE